MMLFISVLQGDSLLGSPLQAVTLGVTVVLLLVLLHIQRGRVSATSVPPETLAWIQDLKVRPTVLEPTRACLESLDWIQRIRLSRTALRFSSSATPVEAATIVEPATVLAQPDDAMEGHEPDAAHRHDDVRVLRLHVKSLETALDEQIERARELGEQLQAPAPPAQDLDAVLATIRGLRTSMALDAAALRVLDRVEAAVSRLGGVPTGLTRPTLPASRSAEATASDVDTPGLVAPGVEHVAPASYVPETELTSVEQHPTMDLPAETDSSADEPVDATTPVEETAAEVASAPVMRVPDHLVQPVPAPEPAQSATSRRRWARRLAA